MAREKKRKATRYESWLESSSARAVVLGVDPGASAGAALVVPGDGGPTVRWARAIATDTRDVEAALHDALLEARCLDAPLVVVVEEWGRGGPLGMDQWLGLGAAAGAWKRAAGILADEEGGRYLVRSRAVLRVNQRTWRSVVIPEAGTRTEGVFKAYDTKGWKRAATRRAAELFGPEVAALGSDACEAVLLGYYATRTPEVAEVARKYARKTGLS